jgi:hypothetical protein
MCSCSERPGVAQGRFEDGGPKTEFQLPVKFWCTRGSLWHTCHSRGCMGPVSLSPGFISRGRHHSMAYRLRIGAQTLLSACQALLTPARSKEANL